VLNRDGTIPVEVGTTRKVSAVLWIERNYRSGGEVSVLLALRFLKLSLNRGESITIFFTKNSSVVRRSGNRGHIRFGGGSRKSQHLINEVDVSRRRSIYRYRARRPNAKTVGNTILNALSNCPNRIVRPITVS